MVWGAKNCDQVPQISYLTVAAAFAKTGALPDQTGEPKKYRGDQNLLARLHQRQPYALATGKQVECLDKQL
jgi:hypothetical protein